MGMIVDRWESGGGRSIVNKQRSIKRYRDQVCRAVAKAVTGREITNIE